MATTSDPHVFNEAEEGREGDDHHDRIQHSGDCTAACRDEPWSDDAGSGARYRDRTAHHLTV